MGPTIGVILNLARQAGEFGFMLHIMRLAGQENVSDGYPSHRKIAYVSTSTPLRPTALNTEVTTGDGIGDGTVLDWGGLPMQPGVLIKAHGRRLVKRHIS